MKRLVAARHMPRSLAELLAAADRMAEACIRGTFCPGCDRRLGEDAHAHDCPVGEWFELWGDDE